MIGLAHADAVIVAGRGGIDLVASHEQHTAAPRLVPADREARLRQQIRDGVGRIETVAEIGDIVEPHCAGGIRAHMRGQVGAGAQLGLVDRIEGGLDEAAVGILPEQVRHDHPQQEFRQQHRPEPAGHPWKAGQVRELHGLRGEVDQIGPYYGRHGCSQRITCAGRCEHRARLRRSMVRNSLHLAN